MPKTQRAAAPVHDENEAAHAASMKWLDDLAASDDREAESVPQEVREVGAAVTALRRAEADVEAAVLRARRAKASWNTIALPLGVSRQAARQRFAHLERSAAVADGGTERQQLLDALVEQDKSSTTAAAPPNRPTRLTVTGGLVVVLDLEGEATYAEVKAALNAEGFVSETSHTITLEGMPGRTRLVISVHTPTEAITGADVPGLPAVQVMRAVADALVSIEAGRGGSM